MGSWRPNSWPPTSYTPLKQHDIPLLGLDWLLPTAFTDQAKLSPLSSSSETHLWSFPLTGQCHLLLYQHNQGHQAHTTPACLTPSPSLCLLVSEDKASLILIKVHQPRCTSSHSFQALLRTCYLSAPHLLLTIPPPWNLWTGLRLPSAQKKKRSFLSQSSSSTHFSPTMALSVSSLSLPVKSLFCTYYRAWHITGTP